MRFQAIVLKNRAAEETKRDKDLIILAVVSAVLAGFAIHMDSTPLLIGAMLIGPFFDPILSLVVLGILDRNRKKFFHALLLLMAMTLAGWLAAVLQFMFLKTFNGFEINEIINYGWLEALIVAMILGGVGMLMWVWTKTSSLAAGVSIAISLVPPLVNTAIAFVFTNWEVFWHYSGLFLLNCIGILIGAFLVFKILVRD